MKRRAFPTRALGLLGGDAAALTDGIFNAEGHLTTFPYLPHPNEGYEHFHD